MSSKNIVPILLTGIHRSGTTFAGRMLSIPRCVGYIDEPFNRDYGIQESKAWFPYFNQESVQEVLTLWQRVLEGKAVYKRPFMPVREQRTAHSLGRIVLKSRPNLAYQRYRVNPFLRQVVVKDPFLCFMSETLYRELSVPVVVLIRHPAAFVASVLRCGFHFDIRNLMRNQQLMADFFDEVLNGIQPDNFSELEHAAWTWRCVYSVLFQFLDRNPEMIAVRHEDLCENPVQEFASLYEKLGLPFAARVQKRILTMTGAVNPSKAPGNRIHHLQRDSRSLVDGWKSVLTAEELRTVRSITEETASRFYARPDWSSLFQQA